jgi:ABC-type phosphate transport system auxiliary subunit
MNAKTEEKQGFLFNIVSNIGAGHQVQVAFNLPVGAKKPDMDELFDQYFAALKRQEARLRLPTIEAEVAKQKALIVGQVTAIERLKESLTLVGNKRQQDAQYQASMAQIEADKSKLEILETSLKSTYEEAELKSA